MNNPPRYRWKITHRLLVIDAVDEKIDIPSYIDMRKSGHLNGIDCHGCEIIIELLGYLPFSIVHEEFHIDTPLKHEWRKEMGLRVVPQGMTVNPDGNFLFYGNSVEVKDAYSWTLGESEEICNEHQTLLAFSWGAIDGWEVHVSSPTHRFEDRYIDDIVLKRGMTSASVLLDTYIEKSKG